MPQYWDPNKGAVTIPGSQLIGIGTLTATRDPLVTDDSTQGVSVGYVWFNSTAGALRWWECRSNTAGAAAWVFSGADYTNGGTNPASEVTAFGSQTSAVMAEEGNINRQISSAGINPGSTGNDNVLAAFTLPANAFDILGRGISITAMGSFATNNANKRIKIVYNAATATIGSAVTGGTVIADTGTVTTNGSGWCVSADVYKYGALGANTQIGLHQQSQTGGTVTPLLAPTTNLAATESGAIIIAVTGNATSTATDIVFNFMAINAMN